MQCSRHDRWADEPHFASLLKISGFKIRVRVRLSVNHAAATRLVFGLSHSDHVTPTQIQLLWLLVSYRIRFKLCCLVHAIHYGRSPAYLMETVQSVGTSRSRSGLRYLPPHRWTTLYRGCTRSSASGRSHMQVLPPGTLCPTTFAPWLILSSSENC